MNRVYLVGNLTRDPKLKDINETMTVADIGLAVNEKFKKKDGTDGENTCFVDVTVWNGQAKACGKVLKKGMPVMIEGKLQFDLWGMDEHSGRWDWNTLKQEIVDNGMRNSLLLAPMPTASTSQILANNECFEAFTSNLYVRRTLSGEFIVVNKHLLEDLVELNLWDNDMKESIMRANGSIQHIEEIPAELRELYKTVWEMSMKDIIDMARHRGYFIDQSQSLNLFMKDPDFGKLTSMHFYGWKSGLKTGMYYLRTKAAVDAIKFTLNNDKKAEPIIEEVPVETIVVNENVAMSEAEFKAMIELSKNAGPDDCEMCGS